MNRSTIAGIVAAGLLFGGTAVAAEKPGQWYLAPMISTIWVDNDRLVDDDIGAALAIGRALNDNINLEFHTFGYQLDGLDETDYWGIGLDVMRVFYRDQRISPYLLGGGGWNVKNREFGRDSKDTYANFAFGLLSDLKPGGSVALRTELRYRMDFFSRESDGRSTSYRDLMLNIGLQVPFGQPYAQPMAAEPVAAAPPPPPPPPPAAPATAAAAGAGHHQPRGRALRVRLGAGHCRRARPAARGGGYAEEQPAGAGRGRRPHGLRGQRGVQPGAVGAPCARRA
jgi:OmpA-OmpF porin, OOP family